jgi:hypothetical protein
MGAIQRGGDHSLPHGDLIGDAPRSLRTLRGSPPVRHSRGCRGPGPEGPTFRRGFLRIARRCNSSAAHRRAVSPATADPPRRAGSSSESRWRTIPIRRHHPARAQAIGASRPGWEARSGQARPASRNSRDCMSRLTFKKPRFENRICGNTAAWSLVVSFVFSLQR